MQQSSRVFSYTAQHGPYLRTIVMIGFIFLVEGALVVLLIVLLAPTELLRWILLGGFALLILAMLFGLILAPLMTQHRLTATHLHLRYGFQFKADIPREAIIAVWPVRELIDPFHPISAQYDARKKRIVAAFSEQGQILLTLDQPGYLRVGHATSAVILFNVDRCDEFLALIQPNPDQERITSTERLSQRTHPGESQTTHEQAHSNAQQPALSIVGLTRRYDDFIAVDRLDLKVYPGEIYGFLGPNGAGKTTTIKMLVGLLEPSAGQALIGGYDVWAEPARAKALCGYVPDRAILYERLTGREFLHFLAQMRAIPLSDASERIDHLLTLLDLSDRSDDVCGAYSFGMKRKLALAGALLHEPSVLILDEPLNGLDPRSARRMKDLLTELASCGKAIVLSIHDLATAEAICHRVGIINRGRLVAEGNAHDLRQLAAAPNLEAVFLRLTEEEAECAPLVQ
ncbi:MAG: ABC transporter ATP-binding protein [Chloroflexales bacterium]|nr:ABC transporter ATP-binding protein [Chloroflexales bacterium]